MGTCLSVDDSSDDEIGCGRSARARRKQRKQRIMEVLAAEAKNNEVLFRMPGRMYLNGSSSNACIFTQQGRKGTNQDAMIVWESFASRADTTFCGVFDGHGPFGHLVAKKVRDSLPSKLAAIYKTQARHEMKAVLSSSSINGQEEKKRSTLEAAMEVKDHATENGHTNKVFSVWKDSFLKAYNSMDKELKSHPTIDCFCSGTTAVTMLLQGQDMVIANVGDSRAVLATLVEDDNTKVEAIQLTVDLKPNLPLEAERIKRCKGRVFALEDEPEVARVWLPHDDSPGLAMARAFGDFCLKDFGLIAVPEVTYTRLTERDQFIVLASDGVWDVLSNKEVVDTIWEAPTRTTAARSLVETAVRAWRLKYPTSKVDDCAVVCFYFNKQQRSWQAQASLSTSSGVVEELTGELPTTDQVAEAIGTPEFNRSNTLRLGSDVGGDDVQVFVGESLVAPDKSNDVKSSKVMEENSISVTQGDIVVVEEIKSTAMEKSCIRKEENVAGADDEDMSLSEDTLPSGVKLAYAEVHAIGNGETSPETDIALHDCIIEAAASDTHHMNSPSYERPSPEDQKLGLSEHTAFPPCIIHEEAPSEITVMSDVGEDEGGKAASGGGAAVMGRSSSRRSLAECLSVADEDEWSALEGVARVNSLLNLPRFLGGEKGGSGWGMTAKSGGKGRKSVGAGKKGAAAPGLVRRRRWG